MAQTDLDKLAVLINEVTGMSGGGVVGHADGGNTAPIGDATEIAKDNKKQGKEQRLKDKKLTEEEDEELKTEQMLRQYIRNKIIAIQEVKRKQEEPLRQIIRQLLREGDVSDVHPHRATGINVLEDVLKKAIPTLRADFKRLTTDKAQRDSFRAHIINAVKQQLAPSMVNDKFQPGDPITPSGLLDEPEGGRPEDALGLEEEFRALKEADIDIDITDDDQVPGDPSKKVPVEDDDTPSEQEEFASGLEDMDETGRNMAYTSFRKVSQYILDAYDSLANMDDKEIFIDYLITNLKLYFDKFETEMQSTVDEPTTDSYETAAKTA
jgi:hypothetical protein